MSKIQEALSHYRNSPVSYANDILNVQLDDWQQLVAQKIAEGKDVAVKSCHGPGKSFDAATIATWFLTVHPYSLVPCTAPTQSQLKDSLWSRFDEIVTRSKIEEFVEVTKTEVRVKGYEKSWKIVARSSNNSDNLAGKHADHLLFIVDEAGGVPEEIYEVVEGALTNQGAQLLLIGNPTKPTGYFAETFTDEQLSERFETFTIAGDDSLKPNYEGDHYFVSDRVSDEYVDKMINKYGPESDVTRIRVYGMFPSQDDQALIPYDWVQQAVDRDMTPNPEETHIGVDFAGSGDNENVIVTRQGPVVTNIERYDGDSSTVAAGKVIGTIERLRSDDSVRDIKVKLDKGPIGKGSIDIIKDEVREKEWEDVEVIPVGFGGSVPDDSEYNGLAMYEGELMWLQVKDRLEHGEISLPDSERLITELSSRRASTTPKGKLKLEQKKKMKSRGEVSPDTADAVVLAYYDVEPEDTSFEPQGYEIGSISGPSYWKK